MLKYTVARQLAGKKIFTNRGEEFGKLVDLEVDERTGIIEYLIVDVNPSSRTARRLGVQGQIKIPYSAVVAVSDVIIVDEKEVPTES